MLVTRYTLSEFIQAAKDAYPRWASAWDSPRYRHEAGGSYQDALRYAEQGSDSIVAQAEKMIANFPVIETSGHSWEPSVYGAYPIVPEFLTGQPQCMRASRHVESDSQPITIYSQQFISAGVSKEYYIKRGTALLALVMQLQTIRPVDLKIVATSGRNGCTVVDVDTRPISVAHACALLAEPSVFRQLSLSVWFSILQYDDRYPLADDELTKKALGVEPEDIYVGRLGLGDPIMADPVKWVSEQIETHMHRAELA